VRRSLFIAAIFGWLSVPAGWAESVQPAVSTQTALSTAPIVVPVVVAVSSPTIDAEGEHSEQSFPLKLVEFSGRKVEQFSFANEGSARSTEAPLRSACGPSSQLQVLTIERKQRRRNPSPPFTTSTLQQEASRKLGFSAQRTMRTAQQLYEGVDIGEGSVGLITYMRTDSVTLAAEAVTEMRATIERLYGKEAVAEEVRVYRTKSKNAQEAHEAVRPTSAAVVS